MAPGLLDRLLAGRGYREQMTAEPEPPDRPDNLMAPVPGDPGVHGRFDARRATMSAPSTRPGCAARRGSRLGFCCRWPGAVSSRIIPPGACRFRLAGAMRSLAVCRRLAPLFERLVDLHNDVGLLSEKCDPRASRILGSSPQAFSHVALADTARALARSGEQSRPVRPGGDAD